MQQLIFFWIHFQSSIQQEYFIPNPVPLTSRIPFHHPSRAPPTPCPPFHPSNSRKSPILHPAHPPVSLRACPPTIQRKSLILHPSEEAAISWSLFSPSIPLICIPFFKLVDFTHQNTWALVPFIHLRGWVFSCMQDFYYCNDSYIATHGES